MVLSRAGFTKDGFTVSADVAKLLDDYTTEMKRESMNIFDQVAKEAVQRLKQIGRAHV